MPFKLICAYYPNISYKKDIDPCSRSKVAAKIIEEPSNLMALCRENL